MSDGTVGPVKTPQSEQQTPYHANTHNLYCSAPSSFGTMPSTGIPGLSLINSWSPPPGLSANTTEDSRRSHRSSSRLGGSEGNDITNANLELGPSPSHDVLPAGQSATLAKVPSPSSKTLQTTSTYEQLGSAARPAEIEEPPSFENTTHRIPDMVNATSTAEQAGPSGGTNQSEKRDGITSRTSLSFSDAIDSKVRSGSEVHERPFDQQHYNLAVELSDLIGIAHAPHDVPSGAPSIVAQQAPDVILHQDPSEGTKRTVPTEGSLPTLSGFNDMGDGEALGAEGATSIAHNGTAVRSSNDPHPQYSSFDRAKDAELLHSTDVLAEELQERYLADRGLEEAAIEGINKDLEAEDPEAEASDDDGGFEFDTPEQKAEFLQSKLLKATVNEARSPPTPAGAMVLKDPVAPELLRHANTPPQVSAGSSQVQAPPDVSAGEATFNKSEGGLSITARLNSATSKHNTQLSSVDTLLDSSSDSDSDSDSDSSSKDSDEGGAPMTPRTIAKMMMADVDSSPDQSKKRQKPEEPEMIIVKPDVVVTPDMKIVALGDVLNIVENTVLIKAHNSGEERIIKEGSVLCLENRVVVGAVDDNIGQVREPYYSVLFNNREEMDALGIKEGTKIFYVEKYADYVFTQPLRTAKPYDADDKDEQMYFSSDEAQQEYERAQRKKPSPGGKAPKPINARRAEKNAEWRRKQEESRAARGRGRDSRSHQQSDRGRFQNGRGQNRSFGQQRQEHAGHNQTPQQQHTMQHLTHPPQNRPRRNSRSTSATSLKYDDDADDDGYKPLRRPDNLYAPQQQYQYPSAQPQPPTMQPAVTTPMLPPTAQQMPQHPFSPAPWQQAMQQYMTHPAYAALWQQNMQALAHQQQQQHVPSGSLPFSPPYPPQTAQADPRRSSGGGAEGGGGGGRGGRGRGRGGSGESGSGSRGGASAGEYRIGYYSTFPY